MANGEDHMRVVKGHRAKGKMSWCKTWNLSRLDYVSKWWVVEYMPFMNIHIMFQLYAMMPHQQEMSNGSTWNPLQFWIILPNLQVAKMNKWKHTYDPFDMIICQIRHAKCASTLKPPLNFKGGWT